MQWENGNCCRKLIKCATKIWQTSLKLCHSYYQDITVAKLMKIELVDTTEFSHVVSTVYAHSNVICMESLAPELFVSLTDVFILFWFVRNTTADYGNILL